MVWEALINMHDMGALSVHAPFGGLECICMVWGALSVHAWFGGSGRVCTVWGGGWP